MTTSMPAGLARTSSYPAWNGCGDEALKPCTEIRLLTLRSVFCEFPEP